MLRVRSIRAGYGDLTAIDDVSMAVGEREIVGVIGPNGAGKSTLLRAITGVVPLTAGSVTWCGEPIDRLPTDARARRGIAMVQEGRRLFASLSVRDNLVLGAYHADRATRQAAEDDVLELFPALRDIRGRTAGVLSGGEQQMVAIGRALMSRPRCLLIDEPSLGLAPFIVDEIYRTLPTLVELGVAVVVVEQEVGRVLKVVDRVMVLHEGRSVYEGSGERFRTDPDALASVYLGHELADQGGAA
ncbi:ABC transporter ATP-binding protein [Phycicoccus endophyticus]|uniref:ABC transporter ATP-binding protein n=1 Tax=Phycicoccus endophyticus TaxID=1690220 RepID=A0A7G9R601_9MICO|nr:ABC transporter ATP-binding protein [Phycicoccus endophyticus]QNN51026.1 ABC transporter ATP-binding protein [Phycicoccus endophyticus]